MGVRLYNPTTGRFQSTDPVPGGSSNAYEYAAADPVNKIDLNGRWIALVVRGVAACIRYCSRIYRGAKSAYRAIKKGRKVQKVWRRGNAYGIRYNGRKYGWRAAYDAKVHRFPRAGNRKHLQFNVYKRGRNGWGKVRRIPLWR
ncbi:RHS repeat-associated core domain-containing protein [Streptomyces sp. NPDC093097]|uniref:RHS repeat-associated core domain-containing protein n=1 Tax=Streptomyces sp. NPDC093097 TaxID=3366027 RepID=UPI00380928C8